MKLRHGNFGNVVSFGARRVIESFPAISQVDAYWEGLRDGRLMPSRGEVDPGGLKGALEFAMMLEQVAPGIARIRVAGQHFSDLFGMEVRGMPLSAFFDPDSRNQLSSIVQRVVNRPEVAELTLSSPSGIGRGSLSARLLLAPLRSESDDNRRILGCLQANGQIGRAPRRFAIEDTHMRRIVASARQRTPIRSKSEAAELRQDRSFAEEAAPFESAPRNAAERPYLRLVRSEDE